VLVCGAGVAVNSKLVGPLDRRNNLLDELTSTTSLCSTVFRRITENVSEAWGSRLPYRTTIVSYLLEESSRTIMSLAWDQLCREWKFVNASIIQHSFHNSG
jgi:hypothetical protein